MTTNSGSPDLLAQARRDLSKILTSALLAGVSNVRVAERIASRTPDALDAELVQALLDDLATNPPELPEGLLASLDDFVAVALYSTILDAGTSAQRREILDGNADRLARAARSLRAPVTRHGDPAVRVLVPLGACLCVSGVLSIQGEAARVRLPDDFLMHFRMSDGLRVEAEDSAPAHLRAQVPVADLERAARQLAGGA